MAIEMPKVSGPTGNNNITVDNDKDPGGSEKVRKGSGGGTTETPPPSGNRPDFDPIGEVPKDPGGASEELQAAMEMLRDDPELRQTILDALGGSSSAEDIATLLIKLSGMNRENVLDQRLQARSAARSDLEGAASEMKEAAVKQFAAAVVSAVVAVVSAVITIGSTVASIKSNVEAMKSTKAANAEGKMATISEKLESPNAPSMRESAENSKMLAGNQTFQAQRQADMGMALSKMVGGAGELISGSLQGSSKIDDSEAKLREASATDQQAHGDVTKKAMDDLEEMVKSAIQFLKAMQAAEVDLMANMTRV